MASIPNQQGGEKKRKRERESQKELAGTRAVVPSECLESIQAKPMTATLSAIREQWEVHFSRFFPYPPPITSTCPELVLLQPKFRNRRSIDNWIASSSLALLQLARDHSSSDDVILTVCLNGKILEEHYVSKLQFVWPHVSCLSGFPSRGTRAVFASYRDCLGEIQKFGLRFSKLNETEKFMNVLKEIFKEGRDIEPVNTDFGSDISSHSELSSSNRPLDRTFKDLAIVTPVQPYEPQISPSLLNNEAEQYSVTQEVMPELASSNRPRDRTCKDLTVLTPVQPYKPQISPSLLNTESDQYSCTQDFTPIGNSESNSAPLPPSFTSFLSSCGPLVEQVETQVTQPTASQEVDLKSQIARYMEDPSFQDTLFLVEKIINEMGVV